MKNNQTSRIVIMTLALLASTTFTQTVFAQTESALDSDDNASTISTPATPILSVALPPNARLRFDLDARDEDVLGMVKSLFRGFNGQSLKGMMSSMNSPSKPPVRNDASPSTPEQGASNDIDKATVQMLSDADLGTMLRDVNHLRVVFFELPMPRRTSSGNRSTPAKTPAALSVVSYYEQKYVTGEGGRRIARADFDEMQMLTVGFPNRGFAVVLQAPGMGVVVRADGYPNFEGVGPLAMAAFLRFAPLVR